MKKVFLLIKISFVLLFFVLFAFVSCKLSNIYATESYPFNGIIHADALVIYKTNNSAGTKATELAYGTRVTVLGTATNTKGSCSLYKISYDDGTIGYACSSYITNVDSNTSTSDISGVESYSDYCTYLGKQGFPESYCPYLYYLHAKHPNWIFKADAVDDTLDEASKEEEYKNVLQTSNENYWLKSSPAEADYYQVKASVIASFMDPRNSLFESRIWMFMDNISSKDYADTSSLSKMAGSGNLSNYLSSYKEAGSSYGINPLHLISRSKQEGANSSSYNSVSGIYTTKNEITYDVSNSKVLTDTTGSTLDGYYNYYNINATGTYAIANGLAYAAGYTKKSYESDGKTLTYLRPWTSAELAIKGGAKFIYDDYVGVGQQTIYYEKFNIYSDSSRTTYTHQYMTNINAPQSEANYIYKAYSSSDLIDSAFTFIIPVFEDMGDVYQPVDKDSDSSLSSIKVNDTLISGFDSDVTEYIYNVTTDKDTISVSATATKSTTSVSGTGSYTFKDGEVSVTLTATAEDGSKTSYVVLVKQVVPVVNIKVDDIVNKLDVKVDGSYIYGVSPGTTVSTLVNTVTKNGGTATVKNGSTTITSGILKTGYKVTIKGTSESKTYSIAVRGDLTEDGVVKINDLILIQSQILEKTSLSGVKKYAADINYDNNIKINDLILVQSYILRKASL